MATPAPALQSTVTPASHAAEPQAQPPAAQIASDTKAAPRKIGVAKKRQYDGETVAQEKEDALIRHLKDMAPEPLDSGLETQAFHRMVKPDLNGFFEIIEIAIQRIHNSFGYLNRPNSARGDDTAAWLAPLKWACLREFLLAMERYETQFQAPRSAQAHNRLLLPLDVTYAIQCMRPFVCKDSPTLMLDFKYAFQQVLNKYPTFEREDMDNHEKHQTIVAFLQSRRLTTLSLINHDWDVSLLATGIVEDQNRRAYISREKLSQVNMIFALQLAFFRVRQVNEVVFIPVLTGNNAIMAPHLTVHRRGDYFNHALIWQERVSSVLALQTKIN
jgi:hypothetical protein